MALYEFQLELTALVIALIAGIWEWGHKGLLEYSKKIYRTLLVILFLSIGIAGVEVLLLDNVTETTRVGIHIFAMVLKALQVFLVYCYALILIDDFGKKKQVTLRLIPLGLSAICILLYVIVPSYRILVENGYWICLGIYLLWTLMILCFHEFAVTYSKKIRKSIFWVSIFTAIFVKQVASELYMIDFIVIVLALFLYLFLYWLFWVFQKTVRFFRFLLKLCSCVRIIHIHPSY